MPKVLYIPHRLPNCWPASQHPWSLCMTKSQHTMRGAASQAVTLDDVMPAYHAGSCLSGGHLVEHLGAPQSAPEHPRIPQNTPERPKAPQSARPRARQSTLERANAPRARQNAPQRSRAPHNASKRPSALQSAPEGPGAPQIAPERQHARQHPERPKPPQSARAPGRTTVNNLINLLQKDLEMLPGR